MIKALIFDMDGVLADSEDISITIGIEYFRTLGLEVPKADFEPYLGCGEYTFFTGVAKAKHIDDFQYDAASLFFRERYEEALKRSDIKLPGGEALVENAKKAGLLVSVASSAPKWKVYANINAIGLKSDDFDNVITGEDIKRNKPNADIYELALIKLGIASSEAIVFEDTFGGIAAAKSAAIKSVCLATTLSYADAEKSGADVIISDLAAIPHFDSIEEFETIIREYEGISDEAVIYGANYIAPLKRKMPYSFTLERAIAAAWKSRDNAYAPYSGFKVGAAIVSAASGRIYSGCNVENSSYGATICAERNAIFSAIAAEGAIGIDLLVVVSDDDPPAPPCALCLQVIAEFAKSETKVVLVSKTGREEYKFSDFLPHAFIMPQMRK